MGAAGARVALFMCGEASATEGAAGGPPAARAEAEFRDLGVAGNTSGIGYDVFLVGTAVPLGGAAGSAAAAAEPGGRLTTGGGLLPTAVRRGATAAPAFGPALRELVEACGGTLTWYEAPGAGSSGSGGSERARLDR